MDLITPIKYIAYTIYVLFLIGITLYGLAWLFITIVG